MKLAVVIPVLNEAPLLADCLTALEALRARGVVVIVVDGGSEDGSVAAAQDRADAVVSAPRGRAAQLNAGACHPLARAADVLLFLHADTRLPLRADEAIRLGMARGAVWGRFNVRIAGRHPLLSVVASMMNWRSCSTGIATGDQAMFVRRRVFQSVGGFPSQALMEDIELSARLRKLARPVCLRQRVTTSGRRWDEQGFWQTVWLMWRLRSAYARGVPAQKLATRYGYSPRAAAAVAIMAKAPVAGVAKTRLSGLLGPAGAARAQRGFILRTLDTARRASIGPVALQYDVGVYHRLFSLLSERCGVPCVAQVQGDLGRRMSAVTVDHFFPVGRATLIIVGTDCPVLTPAHFQAAADALIDNDAVFIPAEDGGYVLVGMRRAMPQVFERVDWSTPRTMAQTRERLSQIYARWVELPALWDVDMPADWMRWQTLQAQTSGQQKPAVTR
ncbi:MAG: TIGR04283 family arsenosugar biosynthesis glycosyltransferase [Burkholderiaceae bacterium]